MTAKITASADGTKVTIGTAAEDALQIDATAKLISPLSPYHIQVGAAAQSWQDMSGSRSGGTTFANAPVYTNSTGQTIALALRCIKGAAAATGTVQLYVGSVMITSDDVGESNGASWNSLSVTAQLLVPPGATYRCVLTNAAINQWSELR